jgi:hypothetical protein
LEALGLVSDTQTTSLLPDTGMDLSNYVSKLLQQHGHLYVPGLGYFVHLRKGSYYDKATGTLYPPYYETTFDADHIESEDHNLLNFISSERNISAVSAQYFLEKFPAMLKTKAEAGEFDFEGLGTFLIEQSKLVFKPYRSNTNFNSPLYGLPSLKIKKLENTDQPVQTEVEVPVATVPDFVPEPAIPVTPTPEQETYIPPVPVYNTPPPVKEETEPELEVEEEQPKSKTIYWVILAVIILAAIAGFLAYQYKLINFGTAPVAVKAKPVVQPKADSDTTKKDTLATATVKADSTVKTVQPVVNTTPILSEIPKNTWLILGGSFNNYANAIRAVANYRALGHPEARMLDSVQRKDFFVYKIVFGYQPTKKQADSVKREILKPRTIKAKFIFVEPYK